LVFCGANPNHLGHLRVLLLFFKADSSLKVNLGKSVLVPIGNDWHLGLWDFLSAPKVSWYSARGFLQGKVYLGGHVEKMERRLAQLETDVSFQRWQGHPY